jgi:hypothetical protein
MRDEGDVGRQVYTVLSSMCREGEKVRTDKCYKILGACLKFIDSVFIGCTCRQNCDLSMLFFPLFIVDILFSL